MEKSGVVSIWVGRCYSFGELEDYVAVHYSEDGDSEDSQFEKDFGIDYYDEDFREVNFLDAPSQYFSDIIENHSYFKSISSSFVGKFGDMLDDQYNSVILLYNFDYLGDKRKIKNGNIMFSFIGCTSYDEKDY